MGHDWSGWLTNVQGGYGYGGLRWDSQDPERVQAINLQNLLYSFAGAVIIGFLSGIVGEPTSVLVALVFRLVTILGDCLVFGFSFLIPSGSIKEAGSHELNGKR